MVEKIADALKMLGVVATIGALVIDGIARADHMLWMSALEWLGASILVAIALILVAMSEG